MKRSKRRPEENANLDQRLVIYTQDASEPNLASSLYIYKYIYICIKLKSFYCRYSEFHALHDHQATN